MQAVSRRCFLGAAATGAAALASAPRVALAALATRPPDRSVPLAFAVALDAPNAAPVVDAAWIDAHLAAMEALYGPLGLHPAKASVRAIAATHEHLESRADRDALAAEVRPGVVNVFVVGTLMDVDEPPRMRRGVHWRSRPHGPHADTPTRYVILASEAMPTVLAHEVGHYFGLGHSQTRDNLMSYERTGGPVFLDAWQGRVLQAGARAAFASGELVGR